jgi:hypothetical protein
MPKFLSIKSKIDAIKRMEKEMAMREAHQEKMEFSSPAGKILKDGLELEKT